MFGKNPRMNPLQARKQLLIAESELNRAQLMEEWSAMAGEARLLARQAKAMGLLASAAGILAAGLSSFRRKRAAPPGEKLSWWRTLLKFAGVANSLWSAFHRKEDSQADK